MSAQPENHQMEGVQDPTTKSKGKGRAQEGDAMEESNDDDSSDESGAEDQAGEGTQYSYEHVQPPTDIAKVEEPDEDNMEEIETDNILTSRTRGKNIDFAKANQELGDDDEEDDDEDFVDPDDEMKD
ncbi:Histone H2A.Z-specific chaperone [Plenodomus lingam]|uniref:Histone H2A.Z-specific chaperone n=1 Tax=Leptosphaeria maculans TaxID=5022 RepID=UPI003321440E|nr:Histone H2A.Z-specific chaperone [Plenodomus lingam]